VPEPLRRRVRAGALAALTAAAGRLPRPALEAPLAAAAGLARWSRYERRALENLELALGGETTLGERRRIARGVRRHAARLLASWVELAHPEPPARRAERLARRVAIDASVSLLDDALAAGRGALVVTAHLGDWELLAASLRARGHDGAVVGLERRRDSSSRWLLAMRAASGVRTLPQEVAPRELLRILASGGVIGLLADLEARRIAGELLPFFGRPALTMTAPAALARAARIPLLPARCVLAGGRYELSLDPALELARSLPRRAAERDLLTRLNATYERWIRATPEQWAWHQRRWR
jgi:KDO2-lipid IV(A) lauroyltransferase